MSVPTLSVQPYVVCPDTTPTDSPVVGDGGIREETHNDASPFALGGGDA